MHPCFQRGAWPTVAGMCTEALVEALAFRARRAGVLKTLLRGMGVEAVDIDRSGQAGKATQGGVSYPGAANGSGPAGAGDIAVLRAFATAHVDDHAGTINIRAPAGGCLPAVAGHRHRWYAGRRDKRGNRTHGRSVRASSKLKDADRELVLLGASHRSCVVHAARVWYWRKA